MKKTWILPLLLLLLLLAACGNTAPAAQTEPPEPTAAPTPVPTPSDTPEPTPEPEMHLQIREVMSANKSTLCDEQGRFPDWIEIQNNGEESAALSGCVLLCGSARWELGEEELESGALRLIFCSAEHTGFGISDEGETLALLSPGGKELDRVELPPLEADTAWTPEGITCWATPGYPNDRAGYDAMQEQRGAAELSIGEVVVRDENGDWAELWNTGEKPVSLADYRLSDKEKQRDLYPLPEGELLPGERIVLSLDEGPFSLNAGRDQLYLSRADGTLIDYVNLHDLSLGGSMGRLEGRGGFWYFAASSPGKENGAGFRTVAQKPECAEKDGVFENVDRVTVTLSGEGEIRYTTDGSMPTAESALYTEPLQLEETTVIRAASFVEDALPSRALSLSYLINEHHVLPVTSLVCEPKELFGLDGIYDNTALENEIAGALMFYDGEEGFSLDCGIKPHGATSRLTQPKKTLKVLFRDCYSGELPYDLFHNDVERFSSILLRAPREEHYSSLQRDALMHRLAAEAFPALPSQAYRYSVLYINGQYWGVYSLREAHSPAHYANHYGRDVDQVLQYRGDWGKETGFDDIFNFAVGSDMRKDENYEQVAQHVDLDSVIGWAIMEAFCGNIDGHSSNMRFYYTTDDQVMHYGLVDLDLGLEDYPGFNSPYLMGYEFNRLLGSLTDNAHFREEFLRQFGQALDGPLAIEHVDAVLDEIADEIRPEIARDRERWGSSVSTWEDLVERNHRYFYAIGDYHDFLVYSLKRYMGGTPEWEAFIASRQN